MIGYLLSLRMHNRYKEILRDRRRFIARLRFEDEGANLVSFARPYSEQMALIDAFRNPEIRRIVVLKPRQIGISTANCADTFYETFVTRKALRTLVATDHNKTTRSLFLKFSRFYESLPEQVKSFNPFKINRTEKTLVSQRTGALIDHMTALGKAHGRSWTYQRLIAEELAYWKDAESVWGALRSTIHQGDDTKIVIISTPNGPGDFYHHRVMKAIEAERQGDPGTKFLFSKWSDHSTYYSEPPKNWEPTEEEHQLSLQHDLNWGQLYWRHTMIHGIDGIGEMRFRREYPLTVEDGFIVLEGCWFDVDHLTKVLSHLPDQKGLGEQRIFHRPKLGHDYVIGCDPSWCSWKQGDGL